MTTETILTTQEILHEYHGTDTDLDFARAIEQAVLQSLEIQALRKDREDAGMAEIVREAAQIIAAIPPEHAPDNIRWPIVDELEGFASKIDHARSVEERK